MLTKLQVAEQLVTAAKAVDSPSREEFHKLVGLFCSAFVLIDADLADITGASRPTVQRWRAATGAPARASRKGMVKLMAKYARAHAKPEAQPANSDQVYEAHRAAAVAG